MKKRFVVLSVVLSLALLMVSTGTALAAGKGKPTEFTATMTVWGVSPEPPPTPIPPVAGEGENLRWLVKDRQVFGAVLGDITGGFTVLYDANVDLNQAGTIHGTLDFDCSPAGTIHGLIRGRTSPGVPAPLVWPFLGDPPYSLLPPEVKGYITLLWSQGHSFALLPIEFDGSVTLQGGTGMYEGRQGTAKCDGVMANTVIAISSTGESHVVAMIPSGMTLTGKWHQK